MEFDFDLENPLLTCQDNISLLFSIEIDHMLSKTYLQSLGEETGSNSRVRSKIVGFIHCFSRNFGSFSSYLAVNYMDRFLSTQSTLDEKPRIMKLVAISCVSLALKMSKTDFYISDLQDNDGCGVDSLMVERMEMLVLGALKWRMRSVNPFCFLGFYISLFKLNDQASPQLLKSKAVEIIFKAQNDIKLLEFNPSIISASALLCASNEVFSLCLLSYIREALSKCEYVNKENLSKCYNVMLQAILDGYESALLEKDHSSSCTPKSVLELSQCSNFSNSDNKQITFSGMSTVSSDQDRFRKRRKLI